MGILHHHLGFNGNNMSEALYNWLCENLPEGKTILELGSGWSSSQLMKKWNLYSIEHNKDWFKKYNPQSFLVPMSGRPPDGWYNIDILREALSGLKYDLILVDGPWHGREHFPEHLDLFDTSVTMVFDDVARKLGQDVVLKTADAVGRRGMFLGYGGGLFGIIEGDTIGGTTLPSRDNRYKKLIPQPNMSDHSFHNHSITQRLFYHIRNTLPDGGTILELGSGYGTGELAKHYKMYSVEHNKEWLDKYDSTYLYVPLKEHKPLANHTETLWYDANILRGKLHGIKYDLLLIDGPPQTRSGFYKYMDLFDSRAIWVFDDMHRDIDRKVVVSVSSRLMRPYIVYCSDDGKPFAVINDPVLHEDS